MVFFFYYYNYDKMHLLGGQWGAGTVHLKQLLISYQEGEKEWQKIRSERFLYVEVNKDISRLIKYSGVGERNLKFSHNHHNTPDLGTIY